MGIGFAMPCAADYTAVSRIRIWSNTLLK